jgi:DNA-binding MarR family transcriptional regulator
MPGQLQAELKQNKRFETLEEEALVSIARTSAVLDHAAGDTFGEFGITRTQYNVLRILRGAQPDGLCRNEVRDRMVAQVPDTTRLLDRMEEGGLIERKRHSGDRRMVTTRITRDGLKLLSRLEEPLAEFRQAWLSHLSQAELRNLVDLLAKVRRPPAH